MPARLSAFVIWALVAASAVFWGLRLVVRAPGAPAYTVAATDTAPLRADLTRLFGAPTVAAAPSAQTPAMASRFQLTGVVAPKAPGGPGVALIAVDGKMPRAFRVGSAIDGDLVLQSVSHRSASIGPASGKPAVVLEMPPLPVAATGSLPPAPQMLPPGVGMPPPGGVPVPSAPMPAPTSVQPGGMQPLTPVVPGGAASMPGRFPSPEFPRQNEPRRGTVSQ
jgi:general secretion pathway protein C